MKLQTKMLLVVAVLVLAIPIAAGAARYKGDGAVQDATSGGWDLPAVSPAHSGGTETNCLECHGSGDNQYNCSGNCLAPDMSSYLMTGHKNMLRKVTPGKPWAGPTGIYTTDGSGNTFDWAHGTVSISGVTHPLFYIYGDWMTPLPTSLYDVHNDGKTASSYSCASCHTTGYTATGSNSDGTTLEPTKSFPTITSGITGKWWLNGIQCERCHKDDTNDYGGHNCYINGVLDPTKTNYAACAAAGGTYSVDLPMGGSATARCSECHLSSPDPVNISKVTVKTTTVAGVSEVDFASHILSKEFLNSPHARFTGTMAQLTAGTGKYSSHFSDGTCSVTTDLTKADCTKDKGTWTSFQGGCTTCHNVHESTLPEINDVSATMKNACGINCHAGQANFTTINHPYGTGTPLEDPSDVTSACKTCHMPVTAVGVAAHLFRINVDPSYSTFPSLAQYNGGQTTANTYPEGSTNWAAVGIDLDLACGQCHGGGANGAGAKVYPLSKAELALYAKGMHGTTANTPPTAAMAGGRL